MPYLGNKPLVGEFIKLDSISVTATDTFPLQRSSAAFFPGATNQLIVSVNGVTQAPGDAYSVNGSNIVFTETLSSSDVIDYILCLGEIGDSVTPTDGTVTAAKMSETLYRDPLRINASTISNNITIASGERAMVAGDVAINNGITLTVNGVLTVV